MRVAEDTLAERERTDCYQTENEESDGRIGAEVQIISPVKVVVSVKREVPTKEAVTEFCLLFTEIAMGLTKKSGRMQVENSTLQIPDGRFNAGELCQQVEARGECKRTVDNSRNTVIAGERFAEKAVRV